MNLFVILNRGKDQLACNAMLSQLHTTYTILYTYSVALLGLQMVLSTLGCFLGGIQPALYNHVGKSMLYRIYIGLLSPSIHPIEIDFLPALPLTLFMYVLVCTNAAEDIICSSEQQQQHRRLFVPAMMLYVIFLYMKTFAEWLTK